MSDNALSMKQSGVRWLWLAVLIFIADIGIKFIVMDNMGYGWANRIEITSFFNLLYVHNYGAAFSFLSDQSGWQRWLFFSIALVVCGVLVSWMRALPATDKWLNISYAMVIGGAAANNFYDRLVHGYVVDYLDFYWGSYHWPAFNLADAAIVLGTALILLDGFRKKPEESPQ